ncbi:MAG: hypothetical protein ACR2MS_03575 [Weeksellaceae bacterium]
MKKWLLILFCSCAFILNAQAELQDFTTYYLFNVGYTYQNINYFEGGLNAYMVRPNNDIVDIGVTANVGYSDNELIVIPEAQLGYHFGRKESLPDFYSPEFNAGFWVIRTSVSPWHITPEVGVSLVDLIDITVGYGFEFREHDKVDLEGIKAGLSVRIPFLLIWHD